MLSTPDFSTLAIQALQIIWINILLSGDNAVVIALACRKLPEHQRKWAIMAGSGAAVLLRIVITIFVVQLLKVPYVKLVSGLLLLWIAFELPRDDSDEKEVSAAGSIWSAVRTITLADAVMSLDNVVAVAAAARGSLGLIIFGIALSVPLIVFGSTLVLKLLNRFPLLTVAGAALLGWVAGEIMVSDPAIETWIGPLPPHADLAAQAAGAALIVIATVVRRLVKRRRKPPPQLNDPGLRTDG